MKINISKFLIYLLLAGLLSACAAAPHTDQQTSDTSYSQKDLAKITALQTDLAALNGRTDPGEARQIAETSIRYSAFLADEYDLVSPPVLHNVLVRVGLKDRGLCHHWTSDLMKQLERLDLQNYHLYWGVAHRGSELREHNSVVVAARGNDFEEGMVLDPWRNSGELHWVPVKDDHYPWKERPRNEW